MIRCFFLIALIYLSIFGCGYVFVRKFAWSFLEKLSAALACGMFITYIASLLIYVLHAPLGFHHVLAGLGMSGCWFARNSFQKLRSKREIHLIGWGFLALLTWTLGALALIRNYSGGGWSEDWFLHYHRSLFFLEHWEPFDARLGVLPFPSRPPFLNLICAHFLALIGKDFAYYQEIYTLLNLLFFFPALGFATLYSKKSALPALLLACVFMFNPMVLQNSTYSWPRLLVVFFVLLGLLLYRQGLSRKDPLRVCCAFFSLAMGILTHYSAGPYAVFLALHYLIFVFPKRSSRWKELATLVLGSAMILFTWISWSIATYGMHLTFSSSTTANDYRASESTKMITTVLQNIYYTLIPHVLRPIHDPTWLNQGNPLGYLRDSLFLIYQTSLFFGLGCAGAFLMIAQLIQQKKSAFWVGLVLFCSGLGIAAVGRPEEFGVAHSCLQPIIILGLVSLAMHFSTWPRTLQSFALFGAAMDLALGIVLHLYLSHKTFGPTPHVQGGYKVNAADQLSHATYLNWVDKQKTGFIFFGDYFSDVSGLVVLGMTVLLGMVMWRLSQKGQTESR